MGRCTVTVTKDTALQGLRVSSHAKEPESRSFLLLRPPLCRLPPLPECPTPTRGDIYRFLSPTGYLLLFGGNADFIRGIFSLLVCTHWHGAGSTPVPVLA